jgi:hypothetical protein
MDEPNPTDVERMRRHRQLGQTGQPPYHPGIPLREAPGRLVFAYPEFVAAYQRMRATVVEDRLDDMIEIVDHPDLDPLDKRGRIDHVARTRW